MAATVWIVRRPATADARNVKDEITTCIINKDDTTVNEAQAIAAAEAAARAAGYDIPDGYFETADQWDAAGQIDADDDAIFFGRRRLEAIA